MAVQPHRTSWSDERLDDMNQMIREGFARTEQDMRELSADIRSFRTEVSERFDRQNSRFDDRFDRIDDRFDRINERFDSLQRVMIVGLFSICAGILAAAVGGLLPLS